MSTRSCMDVRADLSAYLDGDLDNGLANATRAHLDRCAACRSELDLLRLTVGALRRLPDLPPPAAILSGVRARLRPEPWYRRLLGGGLSHYGFPLSAAATLVVVFGITLFVARYPDMPKTISRDASPPYPAPAAPRSSPPPALELQEKSARMAPPSPTARDKGGDRQTAPAPVPAPAPPARVELKAKRAPSPALPSQGATDGKGEVAAPASPPLESKVVLGQSTEPKPLNAAPKDAPREEPRRVDNLVAAAAEGSVASGDFPVEQSAGAPAAPHAAAAFDGSAEKAGVLPSPLAKKAESPAAFALKADRGAAPGRARIIGEKETASAWTRIVCLLPPDGDTVDDLERLLRREGAGQITVRELAPPAVREALAPHRGRIGSLPAPLQGWTVTARVPPGEFTRLLDALARRTGVRILEQPATPATSADLPERLDLRITVLR